MGIAVEDSTRKKVASAFDEGSVPLRDLFDALLNEVQLSMKLDILPRFLDSKPYHDLLATDTARPMVGEKEEPASFESNKWRPAMSPPAVSLSGCAR